MYMPRIDGDYSRDMVKSWHFISIQHKNHANL